MINTMEVGYMDELKVHFENDELLWLEKKKNRA